MYISLEFNGEFAINGSPRHPKRDVTDTGKIKFHCMLLGKGYFELLKVWMTIVESGWNVWVWLVGVVSRRRVWLVGVGGIYGCG